MLILVIVGLLIAVGVVQFTIVCKDAKRRFARYEKMATSIQTSYGTVKYIDVGQGEVILSVHGICGGYDQAYDTLAGKEEQYRILAPARFGYEGSDLPKDATIEKQVETFVELLDQLHIEKAYVLATSAGGTTAIKFAFMHPERTKGLILFCSGYPALEDPKKEVKFAGPPAIFCNDFTMWTISPLFQPIMGMKPSTLKTIMPLKNKKKGILFDGKVTNTVVVNDWMEYDLSKLTVPVLSIHSKDDRLAKFDKVEPWIKRIPDCTFVPLEGGGHLMEGNHNKVDQIFNSFIERTK